MLLLRLGRLMSLAICCNEVNIMTEFILSILLGIVSADLFYLYIIGAWHDPIFWVEYSEVIILACLIAFCGIFSLYKFIKLVRDE